MEVHKRTHNVANAYSIKLNPEIFNEEEGWLEDEENDNNDNNDDDDDDNNGDDDGEVEDDAVSDDADVGTENIMKI